MKKRLSTILIVLVFVIGLIIMLYPTVSNWYNERANSYIVKTYQEDVGNKTEEEYQAMFDEANAYNDTLSGTVSDFTTGEAEEEAYIEALNVRDGMIGYITIEKLDLNLAIYHGTDETVLQKAVGHLEGSQLPTGELGNNTVLTGHTGLPSAELFTDLTSMEIGDTFQVTVLNKVFTYEVYNISVVEPTETELLMPIEGKDIVTLVTCTPYGINSHRLLVQGEQISVEDAFADIVVEEAVEVDGFAFLKEYMVYLPYLAIGLLVILLVVALIRWIRLRDAIKATKVADKEEKEQDKIDKLHKRYLRDEAKFLQREKGLTRDERKVLKLEAKYKKDEAKFLKQEAKRLEKQGRK